MSYLSLKKPAERPALTEKIEATPERIARRRSTATVPFPTMPYSG